VDNGVTRRLGGDKPRHYIFDQAYRPVSKCQGSAPPLAKKTASLIEKETIGTRFRNRMLSGFAFRKNTGKMQVGLPRAD